MRDASALHWVAAPYDSSALLCMPFILHAEFLHKWLVQSVNRQEQSHVGLHIAAGCKISLLMQMQQCAIVVVGLQLAV